MPQSTREPWKPDWTRLLVAAVGFALIVLGAWRERTPELVIGAFLVVLALVFSPYLKTMSVGFWRNAGLTFEQLPPPAAVALDRIGGELREIAEEAPTEDSADEIRDRLGELADQAKAAADEAYASWDSPQFRGWAAGLAHAMQRGDFTSDVEPSYKFVRSSRADDPATRLKSDDIYIHYSFRWWGDWVVALRVTDPAGITSERLVEGSQYMQGQNFNGSYPRHFDDAPPLSAGEYVFEWRRPRDYYGGGPGGVLRCDRLTVTEEMIAGVPHAAELDPVRDEVPSEHQQRVAASQSGDEV